MLTGKEQFTINGIDIGITITDFWRWAYSDISGVLGTMILSEFIVASAIGLVTNDFGRNEALHNGYDFQTSEGIRVSVSSAIYVHASDVDNPEQIIFDISPLKKNTDVFVFCFNKSLSRDECITNLDNWDFYILHASKAGRNGKPLTLPSLLKKEPLWSDYYGLKEAILESTTV